MTTFNERLLLAYNREAKRRVADGERKITYTKVWKAASATSGAATHWFKGVNGMDLDTCIKVAPVLRCNPFWLFDESSGMDTEHSSNAQAMPQATVLKFNPTNPLVKELAEVAQSISDRGIAELIGRAKEVSLQHPRGTNRKEKLK